MSSTRLFSEGEDSGPVASAAEAAAPAAESSGEAGVEAGAAAVVEEEKPMSEAEMAQKAKMAEIERLRAKEKFITVKTGMSNIIRVFVLLKTKVAQPAGGKWACRAWDFRRRCALFSCSAMDCCV